MREMKKSKYHNELYPFMKAVRGNWHNALYLSCKQTICTQYKSCPDFLMAVDADGHPLLLSVETLRSMTGEDIEPGDCLGAIDKQKFGTLFSLYIEWHTVSQADCPLLQILEAQT